MVESGSESSNENTTAVNSESSSAETVAQSNGQPLRGTVKWFNDAKGFGFIEHTSGKDVFVHYSSIISEGFKSLKDGEEVEYEMMQGQKGLHAVKIVRLAKAEPVESTSAGAQNTEDNNP